MPDFSPFLSAAAEACTPFLTRKISMTYLLVGLLLFSLSQISIQENTFDIILNKVTKNSVGGRLEYVEPVTGAEWTIIIKTLHHVNAESSEWDVVFNIYPTCIFNDDDQNCEIQNIALIHHCDNHIYENEAMQYNSPLPMTIYELKPNKEVIRTPFAVSMNCFVTFRIQRVLRYETPNLSVLTVKDIEKYGSNAVGTFFPERNPKDVGHDLKYLSKMKGSKTRPRFVD